MAYLVCVKNEFGESRWVSRYGDTDLRQATVYENKNSDDLHNILLRLVAQTGSVIATDTPSHAAFILDAANVLSENYDTNLASKAGSEQVASKLACMLAEKSPWNMPQVDVDALNDAIVELQEAVSGDKPEPEILAYSLLVLKMLATNLITNGYAVLYPIMKEREVNIK